MASKPAPKKAASRSNAMDAPAPMSAAYRPTAEDKARERRYAAENALRVITQAEKHKMDGKLMADVKKLATEKVAELAKVVKK